jgi:signal transduction histidine kinase
MASLERMEWLKARASSIAADRLLALVLTVYAQASLWLQDDVERRGAAALALLAVTVPLAWRRRRPLGSACVVALGLAAASRLPDGSPEGGFILFPLLVALYSVAAHEPMRPAIAGLVAVFVGATLNVAADPELVTTREVVIADAFFVFFLGGASWLLGRYVRGRREGARAAVTEERTRIARELHDVIAHSVSVMGVQAAAAEELMEREPERARESMRSIQATARDAVLELRRLLGVMREGEQPLPLAPQPGLGQLDGLVRQLGEAGLPVDVRVEGDPRAVPPGIDLSAYRIVQEGLTNALKHARPSHASVTIRYGADLELIVENGRSAGSGLNGSGHGLVGMRERAALYGGTLQAGPVGERRYRVRACLPLPRTP